MSYLTYPIGSKVRYVKDLNDCTNCPVSIGSVGTVVFDDGSDILPLCVKFEEDQIDETKIDTIYNRKLYFDYDELELVDDWK